MMTCMYSGRFVGVPVKMSKCCPLIRPPLSSAVTQPSCVEPSGRRMPSSSWMYTRDLVGVQIDVPAPDAWVIEPDTDCGHLRVAVGAVGRREHRAIRVGVGNHRAPLHVDECAVRQLAVAFLREIGERARTHPSKLPAMRVENWDVAGRRHNFMIAGRPKYLRRPARRLLTESSRPVPGWLLPGCRWLRPALNLRRGSKTALRVRLPRASGSARVRAALLGHCCPHIRHDLSWPLATNGRFISWSI